ncbi:unnamed protein product [Sphagnum troendelagicum]|uniref:Non-haem dioxygenase N-terminal domain-containing protein n=1 Tax=Sphagnum troendelagicum TaxID=128251 RepID=A0ABP0THA4_9BRYO
MEFASELQLSSTDPKPTVAHVVTIRYSDLLNKDMDLTEKLEAGFGPDSLGIIAIAEVPKYKELRYRLLLLASQLAVLPEESKKLLEDPPSKYSFGWSHGKEMLKSGQPDVFKGSFYANPVLDVPTTEKKLIERYPSYCRPNIWPQEQLPELEPAFKVLGQLILEVGMLLAHHCDKYVYSRKPMYEKGKLERMLRDSKCHKGRLLHYFPASCSAEDRTTDMASWCGWHVDHGSLTGLTCALYMKGANETHNPDPQSGLYIRDRSGTVVKAVFGECNIAYQIGEATEIHSGQLFHATPHCVQAAQGEAALGIHRNTFALFMQPQWDEPLNSPEGQEVSSAKCIDILNFGDFTEQRLAMYYSKK